MKEFDFRTSQNHALIAPRNVNIETACILKALKRANDLLTDVSNFEVDIFALLGMRNLSAFVGEVFVVSLNRERPELFIKNPHQDGYPDLLLLDPLGKEHWESLKDRRSEKAPFSPFSTGGLEIKATCGSVPSARDRQRKGLSKHKISETRIQDLLGFDWKSHHRSTNNLLGLLWDFINGLPTIVAVFYRGDLNIEDWGKIVQPRTDGGRTTSVSIMTKKGVKKMYEGWLLVIDSSEYCTQIDKINHGTLLSR